MKSIFFAWLIASLAIGMLSCSEESLTLSSEQFFQIKTNINVFCAEKEPIAEDDLPESITKYLNNNLKDYELDDIYTFVDEDKQFYGLDLTRSGKGKQALFSAEGTLLSLSDFKDDDDDFQVEKLPDSIKVYIAKNFTKEKILEAKRIYGYGMSAYQVELDNDLRLLFSENGALLCQQKNDDEDDDGDCDDDDDDDGDDDDDDGDDDDDDDGDDDSNFSLESISDSIKNIIAIKYPGYTIYELEDESYCDNKKVYKLGLRSNVGLEFHLAFDLNWKFLFEVRHIAKSDLPTVINNALKKDYPLYGFKDNESIQELRLPNGSKRYFLHLHQSAGGDGSSLKVMYASDGKEICKK